MSNQKIQFLMMIGLYLAIILLLISIIVMVKNVKELSSDPIIYGVELKNFDMCSCTDKVGNVYNYNSTAQVFKDRIEYQIPSVNNSYFDSLK